MAWSSDTDSFCSLPLYSTTRGNSAAGPSSVSLGASHLECVQKVDVISDSRNIKALLQLPYR